MGKVKRFPVRGASTPSRPMPPALGWPTCIAPAPEVRAWLMATFIEEGAPLFNEDHQHLLMADWEALWADQGFEKQGRHVVGQAEEIAFRAGGWQKLRQEQQFDEWFGRVPKFIVTFSAGYAASCSDTEWCALVEHELYHVGQRKDEFGNPAFTKDGAPKLFIRGHDVEEFVGVVSRYGPGTGGPLTKLIEAANRGPSIGEARIASVCGTCLQRAA